MMNSNSKAIITFCSHLCVGDGVKPYEPSEWSKLVSVLIEKNLQPSDLLLFSDNDFESKLGWNRDEILRMRRLAERSASLTFELVDCENKGIYVVTRADAEYPRNLKTKLGNSCPPLFYYAGDIGLLKTKAIGYVGSRKIDAQDALFAQNAVRKTVDAGYAVVSGGAKGIDTTASETALAYGGTAIEFLGDSMLKRLKNIQVLEAVQEGRALLLSAVIPDAGFFAGNLMARNKYIYAHSEATVVVRADYNKGGTWTGATESLKKGLCKVLCRENNSSSGNNELIKLGATPIDENWDPELIDCTPDFVIEDESIPEEVYEQTMLEGF